MRGTSLWGRMAVCLLPVMLVAGCTARQYQKRADKETYGIIQAKQKEALGLTNDFTIDTRYSKREADDIKAKEIIEDRLQEGAKEVLTLPDALKAAVENNRQYQLRKENLYLAALTLTRERFSYVPQFF